MIAVIGCGNSNRSDDGVGPEVLRLLAARKFQNANPNVRLLDAGTDGASVMFTARGCERLIIVDACRSNAEPGAIFEVPGHHLEQSHQPAMTLHDFRWNHALFAGRKLFGEAFPGDVTVLLIEAETLAYGIGLSRPVVEAAAKVADRIEALVSIEAREGVLGS